MTVKCIKNFMENPTKEIINSNMKIYLSIGENFEVYGIRIAKECNYYYIFDGDHLIEVPFQMFEVLDPKVSSFWEIETTQGEITFWPKLFYRDGFIEDFAEHEAKEREEFNKLRLEFNKDT